MIQLKAPREQMMKQTRQRRQREALSNCSSHTRPHVHASRIHEHLFQLIYSVGTAYVNLKSRARAVSTFCSGENSPPFKREQSHDEN